MDRQKAKQGLRERRQLRVRSGLFGTPERPRLAISRSLRNISCQIIDDTRGVTICSATTLGSETIQPKGGNQSAAQKIGEAIATKAKSLGIQKVVFDRRWYKYHGRVKALAEAARKGGLKF